MARRPAILIICLALGALVALPGTAAAKASASAGNSLVNSLAVGACAGEKQEIGKRAFRKRYGKRSAKTCVKRKRKEARGAVAEATAECQAELDDFGEENFYLDWDSFSDCVADYAAYIMDGGSFEEDDSEDTGDDPVEPELPL